MGKEYELKPGEGLILKEEYVYAKGKAFSGGGNLILTSNNLVFLKRGLFKTEEIIFPLSSIMVHDGKAQVNVIKKDMEKLLEIYLRDGSPIQFRFGEGLLKQKPLKWADSISAVITGSPASDGNKAAYAIPGMDTVAKYMAGTVDIFKDAFGVKKKEPRRDVRTCTGCGAKVEVSEGVITECPYCDTKNYF